MVACLFIHGRMWILGGGYVGRGGTTLSSLRYDLEQQPRLKTRLFHNDVWSSADGREWTCHLADGNASLGCALVSRYRRVGW